MKIAMVSTWRIPCGVAKYTEELCNDLSNFCELKVFAEYTQAELEPINPDINISYERCYVRGEPFDNLGQKILEYKPNVVHVQFESSMFAESYNSSSLLLKSLKTLQAKGIKTVLTFHTVIPFQNWNTEEVQQLKYWYNNLNSNVIVGNEMVRNEFLKWNNDAKISVIPLGSTIFNPVERSEAAAKLNMDANKIYIVQPGFYGPDKGMIQLVKLLPAIIQKYPNLQLVFAGGLHPLAPEAWKSRTRACIGEIIKLNLTKNVILLGKFVSENELNLWLGLANIVMQNYHWVSGLYSASANAHRLLCANRPIIMNSKDVRLFEFADGVQCCKADESTMLEAVDKCLSNIEYANKISAGAVKYAYETSFKSAAEKHLEVYKK